MIVMTILTVLVSVFFGLFYLVPSLPAMPTAVADPLDFVANMIGSTTAVVAHVLSPPLFAVLILVMAALFTFDYAWAVFWWILRKVPFVNSIRQ